ncbi:YaeQ family protein [Shewanella aestuarii]|uniref:YaeQ family protein n=1 Tax=Shewanella aestuarii TaxID=1028752 RepID=A0A6G9QKD9_9GAMM|nr:YaeQ family protein [Shewanella aestuarii]QIR15030.1 YaeQ family protein [Shewanella aestuarii]
MALKATVYKVNLQIADMDRHYYADHPLTIAQHPSETDTRMMVRILAFALNASDTLQFSKGLCVDDEAELWDVSLSGEVDVWIEFGQADEKWLRKASGRAKQVILYTYGGRSVPIWWQQNQETLARFKNLSVVNIPEEAVEQLGGFVSRNMAIQVSISEGQVWLSDGDKSLMIEPEVLK